jgi:hypothetical protein
MISSDRAVCLIAQVASSTLCEISRLLEDVCAIIRCNVEEADSLKFDLNESLPILQRTPAVLRTLLHDLPAPWIRGTEGPKTWSPFDVVGHLIHGERADWIPRVEHLLEHGESLPFPVFDRFAQVDASRGKSLDDLLDTFAAERETSVRRLEELALTPSDLARRGRHPELGAVTLEQHLATWVAHDLSHIGQIVRVMGKQYVEAVGPWRAYLPMLASR